MNQPGAGPNYYGDYGNPGVFAYGCTNCASRYNNPSAPGSPPGTLAAGCVGAFGWSNSNYPVSDLGCDNAINYYPNNGDNPFPNPGPPPNGRYTAYQNAPPGVPAPLPADLHYGNPPHKLFDLSTQTPIPAGGYAICQLGPSGGNPVVKSGGTVTVTLLQYPFGQVQ